ncbi:hypothetical protein [Flavobacterium celericrescens]|uniref:Protein NO VEIN C-terminal domain-containing protein n=1 Tax=Flavobacterium celericrescens TaxID=2709780 RepID=A0ABX0I909_9FLAO|nr:hypothetical protein [Flavobacterium celericrescens]NHM03607.1 hypothetical protein [Flavobacterium celericrescens]
MNYYNGNALYDYLNINSINHFSFVCENQWQIIYGDKNCEPKLLIGLSGTSSNLIETKKLLDEEKKLWKPLKEIHKRTSIPLVLLRFDKDIEELEEVFIVDYVNNPTNLTKINLKDLHQIFKEFLLPIKENISTGKYLNDKTSNAYHKWQRVSLGSDLKVSDFDLIKYDLSDNIIKIYELKRSYIDLNKWEPYSDDYNNFILVWKVCKRANIEFNILYNQRTKFPFNDDVSKVKVFNIPIDTNEFKIIDLGIFSIEDFLKE